MTIGQRNAQRVASILRARSFKELFLDENPLARWSTAVVAFVVRWLAPRRYRAWCYRHVFTADGGALRIAGHHVLADLRDFCFGASSAFDRDPIIMARREGRRDVFLRITRYLNLDEAQVQTFMEIDDGGWD